MYVLTTHARAVDGNGGTTCLGTYVGTGAPTSGAPKSRAPTRHGSHLASAGPRVIVISHLFFDL